MNEGVNNVQKFDRCEDRDLRKTGDALHPTGSNESRKYTRTYNLYGYIIHNIDSPRRDVIALHTIIKIGLIENRSARLRWTRVEIETVATAAFLWN